MKVGRNELCPCGSGKKYKKCCISKQPTNIPDLENLDFASFLSEAKSKMVESKKVDATSFFNKYDNSDLLKTIALLSVLPENHGKNIRLEEITKQAIQSNNGKNELVKLRRLKNYLRDKFPHNHMEDPPENLFTENIMTIAGNMTVFPGLSEGQMYSLQQFINILGNERSKLNSTFKNEALASTLLLLAISNFVANSLGYDRNMLSDPADDNQIFFPPDEFIQSNKEWLSLSKSELKILATSVKTNISSINDFLLDLSDGVIASNDPNSNPIIFKPIIELDNEYIIVSPVNIVFACVNNILRKALEYEVFDDFINIYAKSSWMHTRYMLKDFDYVQLEFEFPLTDLPIHEGVFIFDTDKVSYVLFVYDDGEGYNPESPLTPKYYNFSDELDKRKKAILDKLKVDFPDYKYFNLDIVNVLNRRVSMLSSTKYMEWDTLNVNTSDVVTLYKNAKCDNLTLFNYSNAISDSPVMTPYFLDNLSYFIENDESFYTSDKGVDGISVMVGNALNLKYESINKQDEHLATFKEEKNIRLIPVTREKLPAILPIYSTRRIPSYTFMVTTYVLDKNIWVKPIDSFIEPENEKQKFDTEICIAIAYWINEMSEGLSREISVNNTPPILINVSTIDATDSVSVFKGLDQDRSIEDEVPVSVDANNVHIDLNEYFLYTLHRNDNIGERILMKKVLLGLNDILINHDEDYVLDKEGINSLLDFYIPVGSKKKLLLQIADFDIRKSAHNVYKLRELVPFEINRQIDHLGKILTSTPYQPKELKKKKDKNQLLRSVVDHFYAELRSLLSLYDFKDMLPKLLYEYESSVQKREFIKFEGTPKIECFKNYYDIHSIVSVEKKKNAQHSLSLRCLIEHIIAEPPKGKNKLEMSGFDKALAYMYNIINWGTINDQIYLDIADLGISLLPSGRIGTDKTFQNTIIDSFHEKKFQENIHDAKEYFQRSFLAIDREITGTDSENELEDIFTDEFGVSYNQFADIVEVSVFMAYDLDGSIYKNKKGSFINEIYGKTGIESDVVVTLISKFSLFNRGKVHNVKDYGYKSFEFFPWRYNRALSYLNKPFILTKEEEIEYVSFGARALMDFWFHILHLIYSGKLRATSSSMKSFLSKGNNKKGKSFNNKVYDLLSNELKPAIVYREVGVSPKSKLYNDSDLGDIDVLVIDDTKKTIIAIENKNINFAKTPYEMNQELLSFIEGDKPWIPKVDKRNSWLIENKEKFNSVHGKDGLIDYKFEYIFVTNEVIPLSFIKANDLKYRFLTYYDLLQNSECIF